MKRRRATEYAVAKYAVFDSAYPTPVGIGYSLRRAVCMQRRIEEVFGRPAYIRRTTPAIESEMETLFQKIRNYNQRKVCHG